MKSALGVIFAIVDKSGHVIIDLHNRDRAPGPLMLQHASAGLSFSSHWECISIGKTFAERVEIPCTAKLFRFTSV